MKKFIGLIILLVFAAACAPAAADNPTPVGGPTAPGEPTAVGGPTAVTGPTAVGGPTAPAGPTAVGGPTAVAGPTAVGGPTAPAGPTNVPPTSVGGAMDRCSLYTGIKFAFVTLDWMPGQPLKFYIKMPGGVPGLEKPVSGDSGLWSYSVNIGANQTQDCQVIPGYPGRLYCSINLPSGYSNSSQVLDLHVNGCGAPIYENPQAGVPSYSTGGASTGGSASGPTLVPTASGGKP